MGAVSVPGDRMGPPAPHLPIPAKPDEPASSARGAEAAKETAAHLVRVIAADPVKIGWLREHGARLLEAAAADLRAHLYTDGAQLVEERAAGYRAGRTPLW
jgi:hypothetical protein